MSDYTALARDGTVYSCALKIIGDTASVELPDGTNANVQDSRIATLGGGYLFWQIAPTSGTAYASRWENIFAEPAYTGITALTKKRIAFGSDKGLLCDNSCFTYDAANNRIAFVPTWYDTVLGIAWHIYGSSNRNAYIDVTGTGDYRAYMAFGIYTSQSDTDAIELMRLTIQDHTNSRWREHRHKFHDRNKDRRKPLQQTWLLGSNADLPASQCQLQQLGGFIGRDQCTRSDRTM